MKVYASQKMSKTSYYALPDNDMVDVFLRKGLPKETDAEGEEIFVYDEVYFKISKDITQKAIEDNFDLLFNDSKALDEIEPSAVEKNRADIDYLAIMAGVEL